MAFAIPEKRSYYELALDDPLPTGSVTFLFTDVEGSTAMHEADERKARDAIERLDKIIAEETRRHSGHVVLEKGEGDSHFCVFSKPSHGVEAAVAIQRAIDAATWEDGAQVKVRAAVHCGEAELRGKTYYGLAVIRCARLRAVAHGGQTIVSQAVQLQLHEHKNHCVDLTDLGNHRLKDLQYPERIYQVDVEGLRTTFPHLRSADYHPNNLPIQTTTFLGRRCEIERVHGLVERHRLTTILGAGGSGKTRLAIQTGAEYLENYPGGTYFVDLIPLATEQEIEYAIVQAITGTAGAGQGPEIDLEKTYLVILDNCEHVIETAAKVAARWLTTYPNVKLLATSREALRIRGEALFALEPLPVPDKDVPFETGSMYDSIRLFEERASLRDERFQLSAANYEAIADLCRLVDGMPLAIEIAASNLDWAPLTELPAMFRKDLELLQSGERDVEGRHQTLGAVYEWSYRLLSDSERRMFESLAAFPANWTIEAAGAIGDPADGPAHVAVASLARKSMILPVEVPGPKRFRMLETVREFAIGKLGGRVGEVQLRLADYFMNLVESAQDKFRGTDQAHWLQQFELDLPSLQLTFETLIDPEPTEALAFTLNLRHFLLRRSLYRLGVEWLDRAIDKNTDGDVYNLAVAKRTLATFHWRLGDYDLAAKEFEQSAAKFKRLKRDKDLAATVHNLGLLHLVKANFGEADKWLHEAATLYDKVGDPFERSRSLLSLSRLHLDQSQPEPAIAWIDQARAILEEIGDEGGMAIADGNTAEAMLQVGRIGDALKALSTAFPRWRSVHDEMAFASAAILLGVALNRLGEVERATEAVRMALACQKRTGSPFSDHQKKLIEEASGGSELHSRGLKQYEFDRAVEWCAACT